METDIALLLVFSAVCIIHLLAVCFRLLGVSAIRNNMFRINQITFLTVLILFVVYAEHLEQPAASVKDLVLGTITSTNLVALLPLFYFLWKVPTKDDIKNLQSSLGVLRSEVKELRDDFKQHMEKYHQK